MQRILKHPLLLVLVVLGVASISLALWYVRIEQIGKDVVPTESSMMERTAQTMGEPALFDVPPADLLPATPAVLPEL